MNGSAINTTNRTFHHVTLEELNHAEFLRLVPTLIFMILIALIGIPGNGLVCYIYRIQYKQSSSRWFIFFLALVDLVFCCVVIPFDIITLNEQFNFSDRFWCKFQVFATLLAILTLGFTLVIVSIDRFRKICKPLGWQINFEKGRILSVAAIVLAFCISVPVFAVYDIHEFQLSGYDVVATECSFRKNTDETNFAFIYVLFGMILFTCALITICVLYCFIGKEIKQHIKKDKINRNVSYTASMARVKDRIRPSMSLRSLSSLFVRKNVNTGVPTQAPAKKTKSVNFATQKKKVNFGATKSVSIGEINRVVNFEPETINPDNDSSESAVISKPRTSSEVTSSDADDPSVDKYNIQSDDDTHDLDIGIPKRQLTRKQKTKSKRIRRSRARKATFSLFLISIAFVLSYLPFLCLLFARSVIYNFDESMSDTERAVYKFFLRSYFLNYAINPFIYGISDSKFRQSCKDVLLLMGERFRGLCNQCS